MILRLGCSADFFYICCKHQPVYPFICFSQCSRKFHSKCNLLPLCFKQSLFPGICVMLTLLLSFLYFLKMLYFLCIAFFTAWARIQLPEGSSSLCLIPSCNLRCSTGFGTEWMLNKLKLNDWWTLIVKLFIVKISRWAYFYH